MPPVSDGSEQDFSTRSDDYPDMDAIRDAHNAPRKTVLQLTGNALVDRFRASMHIDYEKWHDGAGYEVGPLAGATEAERSLIRQYLVPPAGWRDVEALASMNDEQCRAALRTALDSGNAEVQTAVLRYAPWIVANDKRAGLLIDALQHAEFYAGLTGTLDQVAEYHPPAVVQALFRGLFQRPGEVATHFAAMLVFVHGKSGEIFDWNLRPLFLKFNDDPAARRRAFPELCALLGVDETKTLKSIL